jgi:hypothetical protein
MWARGGGHRCQVVFCRAELDREIECAFDTDEPMLGRPPAGDVE